MIQIKKEKFENLCNLINLLGDLVTGDIDDFKIVDDPELTLHIKKLRTAVKEFEAETGYQVNTIALKEISVTTD